MAPFCARLNDDVLQEIFLASCPDTHRGFVLGNGCPIRHFPQFPVSQVCASWRHVALLTPQLWDKISIDKFTDTNAKIARHYLSRAKSRPVSVCIDLCHEVQRITKQDWRSMLTDFLLSCRLRSLTIALETTRIQPIKLYLVLPDLHQWNVENLESLHLIDHGYPLKASIDLDHIRYPKLAVVGTIYKISGLGSSLRSLCCYTSITVTEAWELLSQCPSLESICFKSMIQDDHDNANSLPLIQLQHLRKLELTRRNHYYSKGSFPFSTFIEALSLPIMEHLTIQDGQTLAWSSTAFQSFAHRSDYFSHLHDICILNPSSAIDIGVLLGSMPSLRSMVFSSDHYIVSINHVVLNGLASGLLASRLHSLRVGCIRNPEEFRVMVKSRMKNASISSNGIPAPFKAAGYQMVGYSRFCYVDIYCT